MDITESSDYSQRSGQSVKTRIIRYANGSAQADDDFLAVEEPLEIAIVQKGAVRPLAVTLRTPGDEKALAVGFLLAEGVIREASDVLEIRYKVESDATLPAQRIVIRLRDDLAVDLGSQKRNFPISAACGACGKSALEALKVFRAGPFPVGKGKLSVASLREMPSLLERSQRAFEKTGALHAAARFDWEGSLLAIAEDVGRHNALDKLVGAAALAGEMDWAGSVLLFSGRVGFDLMQKAIGVGCSFVASVGAPSSFAVELANLYRVTLVGFLRGERFNVYSASQRINLLE